ILKITSPVILLIAILISIAIGIAKPVDQTVYNMLHTYLNTDIIQRYLYFVSVIFDPKICLILTICVLAGLFFYHKFKFLCYGFWCFSVILIGTFMHYVIQRRRLSVYLEDYSFAIMH